MNFRDFINFIYGSALRTPFIKSTAAVMVTLSLGAVAVGLWRKMRNGATLAPADQQRTAA